MPAVLGLQRALATEAARLGAAFRFDALSLLAARAAIGGLSRRGDVSCGGRTHLVGCRDGWVAVSLARPEDVEAVPAWTGMARVPDADDELWGELKARLATEGCREVVERGQLVGVPVAPLAGPGGRATGGRRWSARIVPSGEPVRPRPPAGGLAGVLVVDLSSLWAGPLCAMLLGRLGATVVKVESTSRPDGARRGPPAFFDLLNAGKRSVALDFGDPRDVDRLRRYLATADVVVEGSRPRALEQLGIVATDVLAEGPAVWTSITGYGRGGRRRNWSAFGDDAAVAGGLVVRDGAGPCFCVDAVADPLSGLVAASATLAALQTGRRTLVDVAMARVAAAFAGPTMALDRPVAAAAPRVPDACGRGPGLGEHTDEVLGAL